MANEYKYSARLMVSPETHQRMKVFCATRGLRLAMTTEKFINWVLDAMEEYPTMTEVIEKEGFFNGNEWKDDGSGLL